MIKQPPKRPPLQLNAAYPIITQQGLCKSWATHTGTPLDRITFLPGLLSVLRMPGVEPAGFASLDLCEVVRHTNLALESHVEEGGVAAKVIDVHRYGSGLDFIKDDADVVRYVTAMMNAGRVEPIEGIAQIAKIVQSWRANNIYVFANTATLEGCEQATIDFFDTFLPGCFDAILFTRNYHGRGKLTKSKAAEALVQTCMEPFGIPKARKPLIHIDDASRHLESFDSFSIPYVEVTTLQPQFPERPCDCQPHAGSVQAHSPLEAFQKANNLFRETLSW